MNKTVGLGLNVLTIGGGSEAKTRFGDRLTPEALGRLNARAAEPGKGGRAARATLRRYGHPVPTFDTGAVGAVADRQEARTERRLARAERVSGWADSAQHRSEGLYATASRTADAIPFGQPMLTDHYSYRSDANRRNRMRRQFERSFEESDKAEAHRNRAAGIERWEAERLTLPVTLRRIDTLEAEARKMARHLDLDPDNVDDPRNDTRYAQRYDDIEAEIAYWRQHAEKLQADGVKRWTREDFTVGDRVQGHRGDWGTVQKANPKTLVVAWDSWPTNPMPVDYSNVTDRQPNPNPPAIPVKRVGKSPLPKGWELMHGPYGLRLTGPSGRVGLRYVKPSGAGTEQQFAGVEGEIPARAPGDRRGWFIAYSPDGPPRILDLDETGDRDEANAGRYDQGWGDAAERAMRRWAREQAKTGS